MAVKMVCNIPVGGSVVSDISALTNSIFVLHMAHYKFCMMMMMMISVLRDKCKVDRIVVGVHGIFSVPCHY